MQVHLDPDSWSREKKFSRATTRLASPSLSVSLSLPLPLHRYLLPKRTRSWHTSGLTHGLGVSAAANEYVLRRHMLGSWGGPSRRMVSSRTPDANVTSTADGGAANDGGATSSRDEEGRATSGVDREWSQSQSGPASLSMSTDLRNLVISHLSDSGRYSSASPDHHHHHHQETTSDVATIKIGCHDEEESYEGFGSVEGDSVDDGPDSPGGSSSAPSPTGTNSRRWEDLDELSWWKIALCGRHIHTYIFYDRMNNFAEFFCIYFLDLLFINVLLVFK